MKSKNIFIIFITILLNYSIFSGSDFFALNLPDNLKCQILSIQNSINNQLEESKLKLSKSPLKNLHITLKEIGDLNAKERKALRPKFRILAKKHKKFDITDSIESAKLRISKNGLIKLVIGENHKLTKLAKSIDNKLKELKKQNVISVLKKRMDFPKNGHITIGMIMKDDKPIKDTNKYKQKLKEITDSFSNELKVDFTVDNFVLLKSNRPAKPRIYEYKGIFKLSNNKK